MGTPIRVLIAPDKFKGTLTAHAAAHAIADGIRPADAALGAAIEIDLCPIADGGEGTAELLAATWTQTAHRHLTEVTGPLDAPALAPWWHNGAERAAFDTAAACGLALVPPNLRNPARCSTRGVGTLLHLICSHSRNVTIGLGGSATVDAGIGMAAAIGWRFEDRAGDLIASPRGVDLARIAQAVPPADASPVRRTLQSRRVSVLCDVTTPLLGEHGCAALFGPQKGATPAQVKELDDGLRHLVDVVGVAPTERDGAAGGLAYALRAFIAPLVEQLTLESGARAVLHAVGFESRAARADLVITGEGRYDLTSHNGKAVGEVIAAARHARKPLLIIAGIADPTMSQSPGVTITTCSPDGPPEDEADAADRLHAAATSAFDHWLKARPA
jgi:glycerate kinase